MVTISGLSFGCDVSAYQEPTLVDWDDERINFAILKASENLTEDKRVREHSAAVRSAKKPVGLYQFFHPDTDVSRQFTVFKVVADAVEYGGNGDIVPAIDIEYFRLHEVTPKWCDPLRAFADLLEATFAKPLLYCSRSTWICLGRPEWLLEYPLWVPFYMMDGLEPTQTLSASHVPGERDDWCIWQRYVGKLFGTKQNTKATGAVDQNWAQRIPRIGVV